MNDEISIEDEILGKNLVHSDKEDPYGIFHLDQSQMPKKNNKLKDFSSQWVEYVNDIEIPYIMVSDIDDPEENKEQIREIFSRLNNQESLNAQEKRDAIGGYIITVIKNITSTNDFFLKLTISVQIVLLNPTGHLAYMTR